MTSTRWRIGNQTEQGSFLLPELINAVRACLYDYGHVVPLGMHQIKRIADILDAPDTDLPDLMREECRDLPEQIAEKSVRIDIRTARIKAVAAQSASFHGNSHQGQGASRAPFQSRAN